MRSFDGVPEENSILFDYDGVTVELPAMDLVLYQPKAVDCRTSLFALGQNFQFALTF